MKYKCSKCGFESEDSKFCPNCGQKLIEEVVVNENKPAKDKNNVFATLGMAFGIASLSLWFVFLFSSSFASSVDVRKAFLCIMYGVLLCLSIVGIVFSSLGMKANKAFAIPGAITSSIATFCLLIYWFSYLLSL